MLHLRNITELKAEWEELLDVLNDKFDNDLDLQGVIFLIGVQELGQGSRKYTKAEKQDLMHIAVCTVLSPGGFYELSHVDEDGWPHFKQLKPMPDMHPAEQENFLKDHILLYFQNNDFT